MLTLQGWGEGKFVQGNFCGGSFRTSLNNSWENSRASPWKICPGLGTLSHLTCPSALIPFHWSFGSQPGSNLSTPTQTPTLTTVWHHAAVPSQQRKGPFYSHQRKSPLHLLHQLKGPFSGWDCDACKMRGKVRTHPQRDVGKFAQL